MRRLALVAAALLAAQGCSRCGKAGGGGGDPGMALARLLPRDAELIVAVPDLAVLGERLKRLESLKLASFAAQLQGYPTAAELSDSLVQQLGVDPRSRESLHQAGLDPPRGAAVVWRRGGERYSVAAVKDERAFRETVARLARDRLGAGAVSEGSSGSHRTFLFSRTPGGPPELGLLFRDGFAFLAPGAAAGHLGQLASVPEDHALSTDADFQKSLGRLPAERHLYARIPPTSSLAQPGIFISAVITATLTQEAIALHLDTPWSSIPLSREFLEAQQAPDLLPLLPPDAFVVARSLGDPALLEALALQLLGPQVEKTAREVLTNLTPGSVLALSVAPTVSLAAGLPRLDEVRASNPVGLLHLVVAGQVRDPARARTSLDLIPPVARRFGAQLEPSTRQGQKVFITSWSRGEGAHLALVGDKALMAAPLSRMDEAIARAQQEGRPAEGLAADPAFTAFLDRRPLAAVVDLRRLADSVRALPSSAWGVGGFAMKATTLRWLEATDDLRAVTLSLSSKESALQAELSLRLSGP
jgi:hypothetical protein